MLDGPDNRTLHSRSHTRPEKLTTHVIMLEQKSDNVVESYMSPRVHRTHLKLVLHLGCDPGLQCGGPQGAQQLVGPLSREALARGGRGSGGCRGRGRRSGLGDMQRPSLPALCHLMQYAPLVISVVPQLHWLLTRATHSES